MLSSDWIMLGRPINGVVESARIVESQRLSQQEVVQLGRISTKFLDCNNSRHSVLDILPSCEFDTRTAATTNAQCATTLLTLPNELRNEIYQHLLIHDGEIHLAHNFLRGLPRGNHCAPHIGVKPDPPHQDPYLSEPLDLTPTLLATCSKVYTEAAAMLYGANRFRFRTTVCVSEWFLQIRGNARLVEHIHLDYLSYSDSLVILAEQLESTGRLKTLSWSLLPSMRLGAFSAEKFAKGVQGLVEGMMKRSGLMGSLGLLRCRKEESFWCLVIGHKDRECECGQELAERYCAQVQEILRRRLVRKFGL